MMAQFTLAKSYSDAQREERVDYFRKKLATITANGHLSLAIALGVELKLFDALSRSGSAQKPANPLDVSRAAGFLKPRYCFEWLCCMSCGHIIEVDETGQNFWIPEEHCEILTGPDADKFLANTAIIPVFGGVFKHVANCFKSEGPEGLNSSLYKDFYIKMNSLSIALHKKHFIKDFIPLIQMYGPLTNGIEVLDLECGGGFHVLELAKHFPKSRFIGVDMSALAIQSAQTDAKTRNLKNVEFICANPIELDAQWTEMFDLILIFDACHDQCRPDLAIAQAYRCLKPNGLFVMVEINGTGNCYIDRQRLGPDASSMFYAASLFHCLPVGSNSEDALQLGTMWGVEVGKMMLKTAGFVDITAEEISFYELNLLFKARKIIEPTSNEENVQTVDSTQSWRVDSMSKKF